jgi:hypothetical protein|tara:strand:- start:2717 stop:3157 length:441 start_codon:yes stop_codon:yes gene_type:complete
MFTESVSIKGNLEVILLDEKGIQKDYRKIDNLVVAVGKQVIAARLIGNTIAIPSHMAVGTDVTAAATGQTALGAEIGRVVFDSTTRTTNVLTYVATFPAGTGTGALTEAAILNASSTGNMLCRTTFSTVNKAAGDTIVITWNVTVA